MYLCLGVYACSYMHVFVSVHAYVCVCGMCVYIYTCVYVQVLYACVFVCVVYVCMYLYVPMGNKA